MFFMSRALGRDLGWFWYYWLFTTESVDGAIANLQRAGSRTTVTVRQDGQMPSPVVLEVRLGPGRAAAPMRGARMVDDSTALVSVPVEVWFEGRRSYDDVLDFGARVVQAVTLDPCGRFPDRDPSDNVWPRSAAPAAVPGGGGRSWPGYCTEQ